MGERWARARAPSKTSWARARARALHYQRELFQKKNVLEKTRHVPFEKVNVIGLFVMLPNVICQIITLELNKTLELQPKLQLLHLNLF